MSLRRMEPLEMSQEALREGTEAASPPGLAADGHTGRQRPEWFAPSALAAQRRASAIVSLRAAGISLVLMGVNCYLIFQAEAVRGVQLSNAAPFANVIFLLALLTAGNALVNWVAPRYALRVAEMAVIYVMLGVQSCVSSGRFIVWILYAITYGFWFDTPEKGWIAQYGHYLPSWLTVQDKAALKDFYNGNSTLFTAHHLAVWLAPLVGWTLFVCVLGAVLLAIATLFSRRWIYEERLTYPIVELPYQMVSAGTPFWRNRLMWAGFALAAGIELLNGLNYWFPAVPYIPIRRTNLALLFTAPPWNAIKELNLSFYPFIIGLGFLMPVDLAFSVTFFVLVFFASQVFGQATGLNVIPNYPFVHEQEFGAGAALLASLLLGSRRYLREVARAAFGRASEITDAAEARLYRTSLMTLILGTLFLVAFLMAAGLGWWIAAVFVLVYCGLGLIVARMRAELGLPTHMLVGLTGSHILLSTVGNEIIGVRNVPLMTILASFTYYNSNHPLPYQMEGLRLADRENLPASRMCRYIVLALVLGTVAAFTLHLDMLYRLGGAAKARWSLDQGRWTWDQVMPAWINGGAGTLYRKPQWTSVGVMAASFGLCCLLMLLRHRLLWFPLHPIGLLMGYTAADVWVAVALAMVAKWLVLRVTGLRGYRTALPFFLGLALGDITVGMGWIALGIMLNTPTYVFFL